MSVSGEFRRILGDTVCALRERPDAAARELADRLEKAGAAKDLSGAAKRVLDVVGLLVGPDGRLAAGDGDSAGVDGEADRLAAICRIVLGRA